MRNSADLVAIAVEHDSDAFDEFDALFNFFSVCCKMSFS